MHDKVVIYNFISDASLKKAARNKSDWIQSYYNKLLEISLSLHFLTIQIIEVLCNKA